MSIDRTMQQNFQLSSRARRTTDQPISFLISHVIANPHLISLAAGLVDYDTLPGRESAEILRQLLEDSQTAKTVLQYGTTQGLEALRERLLEHMAELDGLHPSDMGTTVNDVVITTGSQQLLYILTDVLVDPGDIVITEWPSYFVYTSLLESAGAHVRCVDIDDDGIIPEKLDALLGSLQKSGDLSRVKIVYTVDYHQNPTGITLSAERRPQVLEIVRKYSTEHRILLLEDAAYRELTFEGKAPPSIKSYDPENRYVALTQTFSKPFSPGMKTGYGILPRDLVEAVNIQKGSHDFGSNNLVQHLLMTAMRNGMYQQHVTELCTAYAKKRDAILAALKTQLGDFAPEETHWTHPTGGMYVYLTLPEHIDTGRHGSLFQRAIEEGTLYVPGEYCYPPDHARQAPRNTLRLAYGTPTLEQIPMAVERLARAIRAVGGHV